jgi:hypothetical protein
MRKSVKLLPIVVAALFTGCISQHPPTAPSLIAGWTDLPLRFQIQQPYDLTPSDRYRFDPATGIYDLWIYFSDKPHAPPPNRTTARTEMRFETYASGEHMFEAEVNVRPGTSACIMQVFDANHGPVTMLIAHPDGTVTVGHTVIKTHAIGRWWNLKVTNDTAPGGKIKIYADNRLVGTYASRGPREYYFKCGVYSRKDSARSESWFRNIKLRVKGGPAGN